MTSLKPVALILAGCAVIILLFSAQESEGRIFGGSRRRLRRSRIRLMRPHKRIGGFTSNTWKAAALAGTIYGGHRYLQSRFYRRYPDQMPTICTNKKELAPNGRVYGPFICPRENQTADFTWCCGLTDEEFCCPENYNSGAEFTHWIVTLPAKLSGVIAVIVVVVTVVICK